MLGRVWLFIETIEPTNSIKEIGEKSDPIPKPLSLSWVIYIVIVMIHIRKMSNKAAQLALGDNMGQ